MKPGYTVVFNDEFDGGGAPDPSKYFFFYTWGDQSNPAEDAHFLQGDTSGAEGKAGYAADAATIADGNLRLTVSKRSVRYGGRTFPYRTGALRVRETQRYGWFEVRARLPHGQGFNPAFWLMPTPYDDNALWEIDGFEAPSCARNKIYMNAHWGSGYDTPNHKQNSSTLDGDFATAFHTYAISWEANALVWYVDGIERKRQTANIPPVPMQVILDLDVGGAWQGLVDATTPIPASLEVDYLRIYKRN